MLFIEHVKWAYRGGDLVVIVSIYNTTIFQDYSG